MNGVKITGYHAEWMMFNGVEYANGGSKTMRKYPEDALLVRILEDAQEESKSLDKRLRSIYITTIQTTEKGGPE